MDRNVFYYETDAKADFGNDFFDGGSTISESILQVLKTEPTLETKQRKLLGLFEKISLEKKEAEAKMEELKAKIEELQRENAVLVAAKIQSQKAISGPPMSPTNLRQGRPVTASGTPANHPTSLRNSMIKGESASTRPFVSRVKQSKKPGELKTNASMVSIHSKNEPKRSLREPLSRSAKHIAHDTEARDKELKKHRNFVESILKVRSQLTDGKTPDKEVAAGNLQGVWQWLKSHFEEYVDLKSNLSKSKKKALVLGLFRDNVRKLLEVETDEEALEKIRNSGRSTKQMTVLVEKAKKAMGFKSKEKGDKSNSEFEKFLQKMC
jgi:hypothetical protein